MKFPKLPKFRVPKWVSGFKITKLFSWSSASKSFYAIWKKFLGQIPRESRTTINAYQHFIVLGTAKSGKTDLVQGLIEQSQDLYPFDTSYTEDPDIQFYVGPNQLIQEISYASLEDKTIQGRKKTIKLWKKLYAKRDPIILVAYNPFTAQNSNQRDLNRFAQLIAGKISLLSEITKKPIKVRLALTHLDKIPGYLEFARFLKQENLRFEINLSSDFESNAIEASLKKFIEDHLTLILTSTAYRDYSKILSFSKEMPSYFHSIEEFLRSIVSRVSFAHAIQLDTLSFVSNQESSTSFNPFQWTKLPSMDLFFKHPMLKHQLAACAVFLMLASPMIYSFFKESNELDVAEKGVSQLNLLQYKNFEEKLIPAYVASSEENSNSFLSRLKPNFFKHKRDLVMNRLAGRIRKHYIEREHGKAILEDKGEIRCLYFNALMHANQTNNLGKYMLTDAKKMATALNIDEKLLKAYIHSCTGKEEVAAKDVVASNYAKVNPFIPFVSFNPWIHFFNKIEELCSQQIYSDEDFEEMVKTSKVLLAAVNRLESDNLPYSVADLLQEELGIEKTPESALVIQCLGGQLQQLTGFLQFVQHSTSPPLAVEEMNIAQFFTKIKNMVEMIDQENSLYNFKLKDKLYLFETKTWVDLVVAHNVERAIQKYILVNNNSGGAIFFKNMPESSDAFQPVYSGSFPYFDKKVKIPGRYTRPEYANKVRATAEKLSHWIDSLKVNPEDKRRFNTFLVNEVVSYLKTYQSHYDKYFNECEIQNVWLSGLKTTLRTIGQDSSNFHDFLKFIHYQTSAFSEPVISLKHMNELNQFDFLNKVLMVDGGEAPYAKYQKLMVELVQDLDKEHAAEMQIPETLTFDLNGIAAVSSNILQNNSKSYFNRVKECLNTLGVPEKYQAVFLKPIHQLHKLGLSDLKKSLENAWAVNFETKINTLLSKFPFNPAGFDTISFEEVNSTLNPKSDFYQSLSQVMSCGCRKNGAIWTPLDSQNLEIDGAILAKLNQVQKITDLLWDAAGEPQPINISVQSVPIKNDPEDNPMVVLSYLVLGNQSIRNLNQTPSWQTVKVDWWKPDNCSVGIELMSKYTTTKSYKSLQKLNCHWGFFELLKDAHAHEDTNNLFTWELIDEPGSKLHKLAFLFEKNPKNLFIQDKRQGG